jgi:hypothetical protein
MMYGPAAAAFVAWAEAHGASGRDGLGMLVEQAAEAFLSGAASSPRRRRCCARCANGSRHRDAASRADVTTSRGRALGRLALLVVVSFVALQLYFLAGSR